MNRLLPCATLRAAVSFLVLANLASLAGCSAGASASDDSAQSAVNGAGRSVQRLSADDAKLLTSISAEDKRGLDGQSYRLVLVGDANDGRVLFHYGFVWEIWHGPGLTSLDDVHTTQRVDDEVGPCGPQFGVHVEIQSKGFDLEVRTGQAGACKLTLETADGGRTQTLRTTASILSSLDRYHRALDGGLELGTARLRVSSTLPRGGEPATLLVAKAASPLAAWKLKMNASVKSIEDVKVGSDGEGVDFTAVGDGPAATHRLSLDKGSLLLDGAP